MNTNVCTLALVAYLAASTGCNFMSESYSLSTATVDRKTFTTASNSLGLNVYVETFYQGKAPAELVTSDISRDWKNEDTDFYHYRIENRSSNPIVLTSVTFAMEEVRNGQVYETRGADTILKEFGTTNIAAGVSVTRSNSWVWGKNGQSRTLIKTYHGKFEGSDLELPVKLIYRKGE